MTTKNTTYSRKLIAEWSDDLKVGIYESAWRVRLYSDRAIAHVPYVKWTGNTGTLATRTHRITGTDLAELITISGQEDADGCDYTDRVWDLVSSIDYWS